VHARKAIAAAVLSIMSVVYATAEPAVVQSKINLRAGPGPAFGIVAVLPTGTRLDVQKCTDEWCRISIGRQAGYASRALIKLGSEAYASAPPVVTNTVPASPKSAGAEARVWQWDDSEWRNRHWQKLERHNLAR
jgi:uncharacterized protein YraI